MSKARSYWSYLDTSVQNLTLKHHCSSWDTRSPNPPPVTIYLFLQSWEGLPSNLQNNTTLIRVHSAIAHSLKWRHLSHHHKSSVYLCLFISVLFQQLWRSFTAWWGWSNGTICKGRQANSSLWWDWAHKSWDCYIWIIWLCDEWKQ